MKAVIYVEGGGDDSATLASCREGFRKLLERAGFEGRMPRIVAKGYRQSAYRAFCIAHKSGEAGYVALLVDSEDPITDVEKPWEHLAVRRDDAMLKPKGATDEQALLMATCMETWIVADRETLKRLYRGGCPQESALPSPVDLEERDCHAVQDALTRATRDCTNAYREGKRSFRALEEIAPARIRKPLPSFDRILSILGAKL